MVFICIYVLEFDDYRYVGRTKDFIMRMKAHHESYISGKDSLRYNVMRELCALEYTRGSIVAVYDIPPQGKSYDQGIANRLEFLWMNRMNANLNRERYLDRFSKKEMINLHDKYWIGDGGNHSILITDA